MSTTARGQLSFVESFLPAQGAGRHASYAALVVFGTFLLWASAKISVPFVPVPMSMTTLAVMVIAGTYGLRLGFITIMTYMLEGALGLPVFAGGGGLAYMMQTTGGYLAGFVVQTLIIGFAVDRGCGNKLFALFAVMLASELAMFMMGMSWLSVFVGVENAWNAGVQPFIAGDLLKTTIAAGLVFTGNSKLRRD